MSTPTAPNDAVRVLRRVLQPRDRQPAREVCDMCGEPLGSAHNHVANLGEHRLLCTCRACYLLFTPDGAGGQRLRAVPERYREVPDFAFTEAQWDALALPVDLVFLFEQSDGERRSVAAYYPSPAGATESQLDLDAWADIVAAHPLLQDVEPDVEAVLVRRQEDGSFACLVVPIDACYELVGLVRQNWSGLRGGDEVWRRIDAFFDGLHRRAGTRTA